MTAATGNERVRLFVYGTLMRGERAHDRLRAAHYLGEFRTTPGYRLLDLVDYPGLVRGGDDAVEGELYAVDARTLAALDASEATDAGASGQQHASWADLGDGTYLLRWASDAPGVFDVFVKIDGLHVLGSPSRLLLAPPPPPPPTRRRLSSTGTSVVDSPSGTKGPAETASRVMGGTDS